MQGRDHADAGRRALEEARWGAAEAAFAAALAEQDVPEVREGLSQALWFHSRIDEAIVHREAAFDAYARAGRCSDAARVGVWISHQYVVTGRASAARGWLARAERAVDGSACAGAAWVAVEQARHAADLEACRIRAQHAMRLAREHDEPDVEIFALSLLGNLEMHAGRRESGLALLEEAMAFAAGGRVRNVQALGEAYCNLVTACTAAGEWERAAEWCDHVTEFARARDITALFGACRATHADVLVARGRWTEAEQALHHALAAFDHHAPAMGAPATAALAELRVRQGRLAEAQQLLAGREEEPASLRALAMLRIAEDEPAIAAALLERGLLGCAGDTAASTALLAALVDARLAARDPDGAAHAAKRLRALAGGSSVALVGARADLARARVALARGRADAAAEPARRALEAFGRLGMPFDAGEARLELARALIPATPALAAEEARAALATFRELGAARAMDLAAAVLRELGAGTAARPREHGELTAREREVLALVERGLSNARIAETLYISEKTAGHHVSRILAKLGVRNRAEAAAHAARTKMGST